MKMYFVASERISKKHYLFAGEIYLENYVLPLHVLGQN